MCHFGFDGGKLKLKIFEGKFIEVLGYHTITNSTKLMNQDYNVKNSSKGN